jgi:hypothetical protein
MRVVRREEGVVLELDARACRVLVELVGRAYAGHRARGRGRLAEVEGFLEEARRVAALGDLLGSEFGTAARRRGGHGGGWVSTGDAAALRGVGRRAVVKAIAERKFPGATRGPDGRSWLIPIDEVIRT